MDGDQVRISFSVEPSHCILRLEGALGVASGEELRQTALELCACQKDVHIDWSGATQIDAAIVQVLLSLRAGLASQNRSLHCVEVVPEPVQNWLRTAGLEDVLGNAGRGA
jgi:anti-anti-sigma regulatory factor